MIEIASSAQSPRETRSTRTKSGFSVGQDATWIGAGGILEAEAKVERDAARVELGSRVVICLSIRGAAGNRDSGAPLPPGARSANDSTGEHRLRRVAPLSVN